MMKKEFARLCPWIVASLLLGTIAWTATDQNSMPNGGPGTAERHPKPPIFTALDTNQDGTIGATEIANAVAALKTLDKNADGKLTPDEYRPPRPSGAGAPAGMGGLSGTPRSLNPQTQASLGGPMGVAPSGTAQPQDAPGSQGGMPHPPKPPIDLALDADQDGTISAAEMAIAATSLKKLDKNGDGRLTRDECLPPRPSQPQSRP